MMKVALGLTVASIATLAVLAARGAARRRVMAALAVAAFAVASAGWVYLRAAEAERTRASVREYCVRVARSLDWVFEDAPKSKPSRLDYNHGMRLGAERLGITAIHFCIEDPGGCPNLPSSDLGDNLQEFAQAIRRGTCK